MNAIIENFNNKITSQPENSPIQAEALDLLMTSSKGHGCARPSEPSMLDFGSIGGKVGGEASGSSESSRLGSDKTDRVDGKKLDSDNLTVHHRKDHGCALPSNPDILDFDSINNGGGGGAKGPGNDRTDGDKKDNRVDGKNVDTDNLTVRHKNPNLPTDLLKDPVRKQPPHVLDGVCFTPNFDKAKLPAPAWAPISEKPTTQPQPAPRAEFPVKRQPGVPRLDP